MNCSKKYYLKSQLPGPFICILVRFVYKLWCALPLLFSTHTPQEYLSSLDIIHRDLACRNILVGDNKNLKISDFGMSRHLPNEEAYVLTSQGQLPLRWMALETLFQREFNTSSDVWSFGVVLWEISTMGEWMVSVLTDNIMFVYLRVLYIIVSYTLHKFMYNIRV